MYRIIELETRVERMQELLVWKEVSAQRGAGCCAMLSSAVLLKLKTHTYL